MTLKPNAVTVDIVVVAIILLAGLKFTLGFEKALDITLYDESNYLHWGVKLAEDGLPPAQLAPLYAAWYYLLSLFQADRVSLYYLNCKLMTVLPPVFVYILLRRYGVLAPVSLIVSWSILISRANADVLPKVTHFALIVILATLIASSRMRSFLWTSLAALIGGLLASYARPEYFLAYVLFSSAFVLVLFLQRTTILARSHLTALLVFGIFSALLLGVAGLPVGNRSMMAFGQHFSFNWVAWSGSNLNPWTNWEEILSRNFGSANGIPEAFLHNPSAFLAHITENFRKLLSTSSTLVLPTIFPAYRLSKIIAAFLIISLFVAYSSNVRNNLVERKRPLAVIGLFLLPALASAIVIYPRDHYLFLMSVLMVIFTAVLLARYPPRQKQADHNQLLLIALLLIALTPYFADQTGAKRSNLDTIRFIESLGISKPVNLLEAEGGYHIYLGDNFHRVAEDDKNSGFGRFLADRSINMIVVTATLLEDARFHDDLEWLEFLANHRRSEYVQMDVPNTETRLIVRADLLSR